MICSLSSYIPFDSMSKSASQGSIECVHLQQKIERLDDLSHWQKHVQQICIHQMPTRDCYWTRSTNTGFSAAPGSACHRAYVMLRDSRWCTNKDCLTGASAGDSNDQGHLTAKRCLPTRRYIVWNVGHDLQLGTICGLEGLQHLWQLLDLEKVTMYHSHLWHLHSRRACMRLMIRARL